MGTGRKFFIVIYGLIISNAVLGLNNPLIKGPIIEGQSILSSPSFSSDGTKIAVLFNTENCTEPDILNIIDANTGKSEYSFPVNNTLHRGYFDQFSTEFFVHGYDRTNFLSKAQVLRYPSFQSVMSCEHSYCHDVPSDVIWSADGKLRLVHYTFKDILWDVLENKKLYTLDPDHRFQKFSPDGTQLIFTGPHLQVRDARTNALFAEIVDANYPNIVALNHDGSRIAANRGLLIDVWETKTPYRKLFSLDGHFDTITHLEYSPDGKRIITGSDDHRVILWDGETGEKIKIIRHKNRIIKVAFNKKRPLMLSVGNDVARISDANSGKLIYKIKSNNKEINYKGFVNEYVTQAIFSPDGQKLLTGITNFTGGFITSTIWTIPDL